MKVITGTLSGNQITLDSPPRLRGKARVQLVMQVVEPLPDDAPIPQSEEEVEFVRRNQERLGKLIKEECDK